MYQVFLGKISSLSTNRWAQALSRHAPEGAHRARWLAGRGLLSRLLAPTPLPEIIHNEQGKPLFAGDYPLWFSLSHSGDEIALIISDEGDVGCSLERIRPQDNWRTLANAVFSGAEHEELEKETPERQLTAFWRIWTRKDRQRVSFSQPLPHRLAESCGLYRNALRTQRRPDPFC